MITTNEKNTDIGRNKEEEMAMIAIYGVLTYADMKQEADLQSIISGITGSTYEDSSYFIKAVVINSVKHYADIVDLLTPNMRNWTFDRLNRVEQAILLLSCAHYLYLEEKVEKGVVIDVAVRLSKKFLDSKDYKFVNAILDKVLVHE